MTDRLTELTDREADRQRTTLNLIASENYASPATLALLGSIWNAKYAEGRPGKRYYAGNALADELELEVQRLALSTFGAADDYGVNVQVLSGSPANAMVYLTALEPDETVLSLDLASGGHLSHLHETSSWRKFYKHASYALTPGPDGDRLDMGAFGRALDEHRPKLAVIGFSAYPPAFEFAPLIRMAHERGALVLADIAHIAGLVAAGRHSSPFAPGPDGADFVTTTTHKTLRGPRGALVYAKIDWLDRLNKTVFPGTSGGPHLSQIAAVGQALREVTGEANYPGGEPFDGYIDRVLSTARALEDGLIATGLVPVSRTSTHLVLVRLPETVDSLELQYRLETLDIITNRNAVPRDPKPAWRPSGLRLGTAALASRGLSVATARQLGELIGHVTQEQISDSAARRQVQAIVSELTWPYS